MMKQYQGFKDQYPDKLVFFRMGDFYELFDDDARKASKILNITLTSRDKGTDPTPMAGFPHHSLDQYLPKVVAAGESAVIVEQIEDPKEAKGVVKRAVTRVVTKGTLDGDLADERKNQYLLSVYQHKDSFHCAWADLSTGELCVSRISATTESLSNLINSYEPAEILVFEGESIELDHDLPIQPIDAKYKKYNHSLDLVKDFYGVKSAESIGMDDAEQALIVVAMLLAYMIETQRMDPDHISRPVTVPLDGFMKLDSATIRNLDLVQNSYTGSTSDSLIGVLDETKTAMGKRLLYSWILNPLINLKSIEARLGVVDHFYDDYEGLKKVRSLLADISDVERLVGKVGLNRANAKELKYLQESAEKAVELHKVLEDLGLKSQLVDLSPHVDGKNSLTSFISLLEAAISDSPPLTIMEGGIVKSGYNAQVDELREISGNSKAWMEKFIDQKKAEADIPTMKIGYNKVFGYYIEVSKAHTDKVPADYIRKQTLVNAERYITDELKQKEEQLLGAQDKLFALEYELFQEIRAEVLPYLEQLRAVGSIIATLDVLVNFAYVAKQRSYSRPILSDTKEAKLQIVEGRHPLVEAILDEPFISNDTELAAKHNRLTLITGPNMSGKSTYIRQVALLTIMAQIGCYVPAERMQLDIVDRVFSRVGASDNLSQGRSTFMVEMEEAANILNSATGKSLVILDEVGRGTSTYDGVSIAWALTEYLVQEVKSRTLFATHYHELLHLEDRFEPIVKNMHVAVKEKDGKITFMRKIVEGGTDQSYGIHVADMAGVPNTVITRAYEILAGLEGDTEQLRTAAKSGELQYQMIDMADNVSSDSGTSAIDNKEASSVPSEDYMQLKGMKERLLDLEVEQMTPIDALLKLKELRESFDQGSDDKD